MGFAAILVNLHACTWC